MKKLAIFFAAAVLCAGLTGCSDSQQAKEYDGKKAVQEVGDALSIRLPAAESAQYADTHGGFHGDGDTFATIRFGEDSAAQTTSLIEEQSWKPLPMTENLSLAIYGGEKDGITYGGIEEMHEIPKAENGYYYFDNQSPDAKNSSDDAQLLAPQSTNMTAALYDEDTKTLYFYALDT